MEIIGVFSNLPSIWEVFNKYLPDILRPYIPQRLEEWTHNRGSNIITFSTVWDICYRLIQEHYTEFKPLLKGLSLCSIVGLGILTFKEDYRTLLHKFSQILKWVIPPLLTNILSWAKNWLLYPVVERAVNYVVDNWVSWPVNKIFSDETAVTVTQFLRWILQLAAKVALDVGIEYAGSCITGAIIRLLQLNEQKEYDNATRMQEDSGQKSSIQEKVLTGTNRKRKCEESEMNPKRVCQQL